MKIPAANCPVCNKSTVVLWVDGAKAFCEQCFLRRSDTVPSGIENFRLVFSPQQLSDGSWASSHRIDFRDMRQFVDECMRPSTARHYKGLLASSSFSVLAMIELMETSLVDGSRQEEFLKGREVVKSLQEERDVLEEEEVHVETRINSCYSAIWRALQSDKQGIQDQLDALRTRQPEIKQRRKEVETQLDQARERLQAFFADESSVEMDKIVSRLSRDYRAWSRGALAIDFDVPVRRVHWHILKPSGDSWLELVRYYENLSRISDRQYDLNRLRSIYDFKPDQVFVGSASFEGYVVFVFEVKGTAVLDCPEVGNAIYIMQAKKWKFLSQLSKTELLRYHRAEVRRIIHRSRWLSDLQFYLRYMGGFQDEV